MMQSKLQCEKTMKVITATSPFPHHRVQHMSAFHKDVFWISFCSSYMLMSFWIIFYVIPESLLINLKVIIIERLIIFCKKRLYICSMTEIMIIKYFQWKKKNELYVDFNFKDECFQVLFFFVKVASIADALWTYWFFVYYFLRGLHYLSVIRAHIPYRSPSYATKAHYSAQKSLFFR